MQKPDAVYFFGTCLIDLVFPNAGLSAMRLLRREGLTIIYPQNQTCCGQPAYNSGYHDEARRVARAQLDAFPRDLPIVVPSASCAGMFRVHYPRLFADTADEARAMAFAERVYELTDFLVRIMAIRLDDLGPPVRVVLHNSCSARRELEIADAVSTLLEGLGKVEAVEPERAPECCGFGGTFSVKEPEISAAMATDKSAAISATGANVLVSQDCGCLMNLEGTLQRQKSDIEVRHIAEFLWERIHED